MTGFVRDGFGCIPGIVSRNIGFCTLVPVFVPSFRGLGYGNICQNHPFANPRDTSVTTSITDRIKCSVNYFLQFLTRSLPEDMPSELI